MTKKLLLLLLVLCSASWVHAAIRNKIVNVDVKKVGRYAEVTVYTTMNIRPEIITLDSPNRVAMVFHNSTIDSATTVASNSPLLNLVQAAQFDEDTVYVIVEPKEELTYEFASIVGRKKALLEFSKARPGSRHRIAPSPAVEPEEETPVAEVQKTATNEIYEVITTEVMGPEQEEPAPESTVITVISSAETSSAIASAEQNPASQKPLIEALKVARPVKKIRAAVQPKQPVTAERPLEGFTVVVDPGHGGRDPGYIGRSGILEKNLTIRVALRLEKLLSDAGARVVLTRRGDVDRKNKSKVEMANGDGADLFVAIHFNSFSSPRIGGCETYYFSDPSREFARVMEKQLSRTVKLKNRGVKKVNYYVIHHTLMPSVLVEAGYLTNPREEKLILTPAYREVIASGICKGITEYVKMSRLWPRSRT